MVRRSGGKGRNRSIDLKKIKLRRDYVNNTSNHLGFASTGRASHLALQRRLGLLPERRIGPGAADRRDIGCHWPLVNDVLKHSPFKSGLMCTIGPPVTDIVPIVLTPTTSPYGKISESLHHGLDRPFSLRAHNLQIVNTTEVIFA
jgi:hypothetical protein